MKIEDQRQPNRSYVRASEIPVGTVFEGIVGGLEDRFGLYLATSFGLVDLRDAEHVRAFKRQTAGVAGPRVYVYEYQPVHGRIVIERDAELDCLFS